MEISQVNRKVIEDLRAWFFAKDRSISLAQNALYYLFTNQANGAYMSMAFIAETILSASAASVTFSNIPQNFRHLMIIARARTDSAAEADEVNVRFNGDAGANYDFQQVYGNGGTAAAGASRATNQLLVIRAEAANSRAAVFSAAVCFVFGYSINSAEKTVLALNQTFGNLSADADLLALLRSGLWRNTNVITSIGITPNAGPNFVSGSRFQLYGIL